MMKFRIINQDLGFRSSSDIMDLIRETRWHQFHQLFYRDYDTGQFVLDFDNADLDTQREFVAFYLTHLIK